MDLILPAPLILGSQSPRRKQLLQDTGFEFEVKVRPVDEEVKDDLTPEEVVKQIARTKA
ncbi:MAG: Maf family protein, partial [Bacteroidetes bacterium]|nr:Maf family protein [Bacteroidota bacterium]